MRVAKHFSALKKKKKSHQPASSKALVIHLPICYLPLLFGCSLLLLLTPQFALAAAYFQSVSLRRSPSISGLPLSPAPVLSLFFSLPTFFSSSSSSLLSPSLLHCFSITIRRRVDSSHSRLLSTACLAQDSCCDPHPPVVVTTLSPSTPALRYHSRPKKKININSSQLLLVLCPSPAEEWVSWRRSTEMK
jgi:hypothetical protein